MDLLIVQDGKLVEFFFDASHTCMYVCQVNQVGIDRSQSIASVRSDLQPMTCGTVCYLLTYLPGNYKLFV